MKANRLPAAEQARRAQRAEAYRSIRALLLAPIPYDILLGMDRREAFIGQFSQQAWDAEESAFAIQEEGTPDEPYASWRERTRPH